MQKPVSAGNATLLEARLVPSGFDAMDTDNSVWLSLPATRPLKVLVSGELATWKRAVEIVPNVELELLGGTGPAGSDYDLII
jgi:hypothetical protein